MAALGHHTKWNGSFRRKFSEKGNTFAFTETTKIFYTFLVDYQCKVSSRIYPYFVNGTTQTYSCVRCENSLQKVSAPSFQIIFLKTIQAIIWKPIYIQTSVLSKPLL